MATAVTEQSFEEHNPQLYLALALLCKESALVTVKNTEFNNGPEAWRALTATYDSNNKGRQRVRMQSTGADCSGDRSSREMGM